MQHTELEALRRLLFFTPPEAATFVGDVSEQSWRRWESGARNVPEDVLRRMQELAAWRQAAIDATIKQISVTPAAAIINLVWYPTLDDWLSLPGRRPELWRPQQSVCAALLSEFPCRLRLVRFDLPTYATWLSGREDGESMRGQWAANIEKHQD